MGPDKLARCVVCGEGMDPALFPAVNHPTCITFTEPEGPDPFSTLVRDTLVDIIHWADTQNPRSLQVQIGPSEIGDPCDRRIGYKVAGIPVINTSFDPWAGVMGTAVHSWLQEAVDLFQRTNGVDDWITETSLSIVDGVEGHSDLYWRSQRTVIDWKTAGPTMFKKMKLHGPAPGYVVQAHIYGYGFEKAGYPVDRVALVFLSRAGWLRDTYVWWEPYNRKVAEVALERLFEIAGTVLDLDVLNQSHRWEQVPAVTSDGCGICPWYNPARSAEMGASHEGCPGR